MISLKVTRNYLLNLNLSLFVSDAQHIFPTYEIRIQKLESLDKLISKFFFFL